MLKSSRHLIITVIFLTILMMGCNNSIDAPQDKKDNNKPIPVVDYKPMGKEVYAPVEIPFVVENPIEINNINVTDNLNNQYNYFEISGLLDKRVERIINEAIKTLFDQLLPYAKGEQLVPYRGVQTMIKEKKIYSSSLSISPYFNSNNILSVLASVSISYYNSFDGYNHFSMSEGLNFDLNSGKTLYIEDVFTNDSNAIEILNNAINKEIDRHRLETSINYDEYSSLALVAPFKGIRHDQKFFLSHNGVNIIIDHNNPEFYFGSYNIVEVPFISQKGNIAITERFYDEGISIFEKVSFEKRFLQSYGGEKQVRTRDAYTKDGTEWYVYISYPEDLPQALINNIDLAQIKQEDWINQLKKDNVVGYVEQNIHGRRVGKYINIGVNINFSIVNQGQWFGDNYVYTEAGEPINLEDLFVKGYNYEPLLMDAIKRSSRDYGLTTEPDIEALLKDLSFAIGDTSVFFTTRPYEWDAVSKHPLRFDIPFKEIGFENLRVFDN